MAYKFQLGKAKLSGSIETAQAITSQGGLTVNGDVDLDAGVINTAELADLSVTVGKLAADAVETAKIKDLAVTNDKLAGSIASTKIAELNAFDTADLAEGANLYYTDTRARAAVSVTDAGGDGSLTYNSGTGVITYTGPSAAEARAHFSAVDAGGDGSFSYADGVFTYTGPSAAEARAHFSAVDAGGDGSFSYDSATGAFTYTGPSASEVRAHLSAAVSGGLSYNSTNGRFAIDALAAGVGLSLASGSLNVNVDASSIEIDADTLRVKALGITNSMLSGAIENAKLVNSSVTVTAGDALSGGGTVALGSSITLDVEVNGDALEIAGDQIALKSSISGARTFANDVTISGNLTVNGTTTYINTTNLDVADALVKIASGSAAFAANQGLQLGGYAELKTAAAVADVGNALSSSLPLVAPSMKAETFYGNFVGASILGIVTEGGATATISANVTRANAASQLLTLPSAPAVGQEHRIKCVVADGSNPVITIQPASGAKLEGVVNAQITLESFGAAVSLVYGGSTEGWMVF